jgi:hypothetical protein
LPDDDSDAVEEKAPGGKNEAAVNAATTKSIYPESPSFVASMILLY